MTTVIELSAELMVVLCAMAQALFLAMVLWRRRQTQRGESWLAAMMLLLAFELFFVIYYEAHLYRRWPALFAADAATTLIYGPLLWLFVRRYTDDKPLPRWQTALHFSPAIIAQLLMYYFMWSNAGTIDFFAELERERARELTVQPWTFNAVDWATNLQSGAYLLACWLSFERYRQRVENEQTNTNRANLHLLRAILWGFDVLWGLMVIIDNVAGPYGVQYQAGALFKLVMSALVFYIGYHVWTHVPYQFQLAPTNHQALNDKPDEASDTQNEKYAKSALDEKTVAQLYSYLSEQMQSKRAWRDPDLDLNALAQSMSLPVHYVSQVINSAAGCNFYDYINQFRIEYVTEQLRNEEAADKAILTVAFDAGFNSKSAFYQAFKRHTGTTPSDYRKQHALNNKTH